MSIQSPSVYRRKFLDYIEFIFFCFSNRRGGREDFRYTSCRLGLHCKFSRLITTKPWTYLFPVDNSIAEYRIVLLTKGSGYVRISLCRMFGLKSDSRSLIVEQCMPGPQWYILHDSLLQSDGAYVFKNKLNIDVGSNFVIQNFPGYIFSKRS